MCGIAVIAGAENAQPRIARMVEAIAHRGPDAQTNASEGACHLGHTRLSIIDLVSGAQPMRAVNDRYAIVFNGEIYNYRELRDELTSAGYALTTTSDTEVLMAAYDRWGEDFLDRLRGMFAFAIWDTKERTLFAARDLFGEKPLYYAEPAGALLLASEIKSILASGLVSSELDLTSIDGYLAYGYVPPARTAWAHIQTVPPAHLLRWKEGGRAEVRPWWTPRLETVPVSLNDAAARVRALLAQAVQRQMVADVPVGAFLSGGLDSSTIVALASRHTNDGRPLKTFSVGFGSFINELPYARAVANAYGTDHHEIDAGAPGVAGMLERMVAVYDEPFADPSNIPTFIVAEFARRHVKVALSGDGGDELFGGYSWYPMLYASESIALPYLQWLVLGVAARLARGRMRRAQRRATAARLASHARDPWDREVMMHTNFRAPARRRMWGNRGVVPYDPSPFRPPDSIEGTNRGYYFDLMAYLPGDILVKVDRAAMAHGLETRAPFLDRDLVEYALSLPPSLKVRGEEGKVVFREAFRELWPRELWDRPKQGFGGPTVQWLRDPEVSAILERVTGKGSALRELLPGLTDRDVASGAYRTWILLVLGLWLERRT